MPVYAALLTSIHVDGQLSVKFGLHDLRVQVALGSR